jgi:hypothetical protein
MVEASIPRARFGIVTLVMKGDRYVPGACALAYSIKKHLHDVRRALFDVICMVTNDVTQNGVETLRKQFDRVIMVPYIRSVMHNTTTRYYQEKYGAWISESFTKWNCLGFYEYQRIAFFDADCLVMQDISLAMMDPCHQAQAAGCFANAWSETVRPMCPPPKKWKPSPNQKPMIDYYHQYIRDSRPCMIPVTPIQYALYGGPQHYDIDDNRNSNNKRMAFVCAGSSIFFQPFEGGVASFVQFCQSPAAQITSLVCGGSGPDDQMIVKFLIEKHPVHKHQEYWQHLHAGWCFIPWKPPILLSQGLQAPQDVFVQHYFNTQKPWEMDPNAWPDLKEWYEAHQATLLQT